jgi:Protein of unknown function (DUF2721)
METFLSANLPRIVEAAIAPVVFLTALAGLMNVFSARLGRVADHIDRITEELERGTVRSDFLTAELAYLRTRSRVLDVAVVLAVIAAIAICCACFSLFVGLLFESGKGARLIFVLAFAAAFFSAIGALLAFAIELVQAGRGLRRKSSASSS